MSVSSPFHSSLRARCNIMHLASIVFFIGTSFQIFIKFAQIMFSCAFLFRYSFQFSILLSSYPISFMSPPTCSLKGKLNCILLPQNILQQQSIALKVKTPPFSLHLRSFKYIYSQVHYLMNITYIHLLFPQTNQFI